MITAVESTVGIVAVGEAVPERIVSNAELSQRVDTSDEWIVSRTGIRERRVAAEGELSSHLAIRAGQIALDRSGLAPAAIDQVIVATASPDAYFPSVAALASDALGTHSAGAHDVSAACSGFVYALVQALGQIQAELAEHVLVIGVDTLTRLLDWDDRSTCILFGDGAGAVVVSAGAQPAARIGVELGADGARGDDLIVRALAPGNRCIVMNGREVFKFATRVMVDSVQRVLERSGAGIDDVDWLVPHQANSRIIDYAVKRLGIDPERVIQNLDRYGNTSAGSIPICLDEAWSDGRITRGDRLLMVGFGGGLTWGTVLMDYAGPSAEVAG